MNRSLPQHETGQIACQNAILTGHVETGTDVKNAAIGFAIYAATIAPAQEHDKIRASKGIDFHAEADFLRALASHLLTVSNEYRTLGAYQEKKHA